MARKTQQKELVITIKDGKMSIDQLGFVGTECADDAITKELKALGRLKELKRKNDTEDRPVHDTSVVDVNF